MNQTRSATVVEITDTSKEQWAVYTLHFKEGIPHGKQAPTRHYTGISNDVAARLASHLAGTSKARLMEVVSERGIEVVLADLRPCDSYQEARELERRLKKHGAASRCPCCKLQA
jgi:predicted GIY-YIG superfamily endonuclease